MTEGRTDAELVDAALADDDWAFGELAGRYRSAAFAVAFHRLGDFEAARDAAQDALVRAYLELRTLRDGSRFGAWLYQIALTTAIGAARRRRVTSSLDEPGSDQIPSLGPSPHESVERSEKAREVRQALQSLPETDRLTVMLHYIDGYSHEEIGSMLGSSVASVKNRVYRARRRLREEMLQTVERSLKDERSVLVKELGVAVNWFGNPCGCRCRHCLLRRSERVCSVSFERAVGVAERFVRWREEAGRHDLPIDVVPGYACDPAHVIESARFNRRFGVTRQFLPMNGIPMRSDDELRALFDLLLANGITQIQTTFCGLREVHDRWVGRTGDFDFLVRSARIAAERGIPVDECVILSCQVLPELPDLVDMLESLPGEHSLCGIFPWDYRGSAKELEDDRVTESEVLGLPESVRRHINLTGPRALRSEAEWTKRIEAGDVPRKNARYHIITVWEQNIEYLESTDCGHVIQEIHEADEPMHRAIPSLSTLADLYADRSGDRLYTIRDLEWKWIDLYLSAHPDIDSSARFTDLGSVIMWKTV